MHQKVVSCASVLPEVQHEEDEGDDAGMDDVENPVGLNHAFPRSFHFVHDPRQVVKNDDLPMEIF